MKILLTNDDGIEAPGLQGLVHALEEAHDCFVVAPAGEQSASGHAISLGKKLIIEEKVPRRIAVHGTPVDCVKFALSELKDFRPDLLVSGINPGPNTGVSVYYSGTISAARESLINRVPSMAISVGSKTATDFSYAASVARSLVEGYEEGVFPLDVFLNVNIPNLPESEIRGIRVVRQAPSRFIEEFIQEEASKNQKTYVLAGEIEVFDPDGTTDQEVLSEGFIALTPLKLDLTDYDSMPIFEKWIQEKRSTWVDLKNT